MSQTSKPLTKEGIELQEGHHSNNEGQQNVAELASLAAKAVALAAAQAEAVAKQAIEHDAAKAAETVALAVIAAAESAARAARVAATEAKAAVEKAAELASRSAREVASATAQAVSTAKRVAAKDIEKALDEVALAFARASQSTERAAVAAATEALAAVGRATALASQSAHDAATTAEQAVAAARQAVEQNAAKAATAVAEAVQKASENANIAAEAAAKLAAEEMGVVVAKLENSENMREQAEGKVRLYVEQLERAMGATLRSVAIMVEQRDPYTAGHERRVGELAAAIGIEMGLSEETINGLRMSGYVHDIGKISVPAELLSKPSKLSSVEFALIKTHVQTGYDILKDVEFPWPLTTVILQHHERLDGSGYPHGLKGDEIIVEARIMAVADVVEAMQSHRPYRPSLGIELALHEIEQNSGKFYDPQVVAACLRMFREKNYTIPA